MKSIIVHSSNTFVMIQIIIALLIALGRIASVEEWEQMSVPEQQELIIDVDTINL